MGDRLRSMRQDRGLSLRELSEQTGLSATLLSQIEREVTEPSLKSLRRIAEVFGESVSALFDDGPANGDVFISRPGERSRMRSPRGFVQYERLAKGNGQLEMLRGELPPGGRSSETFESHQAVECAYVIRGPLTIDTSQAVYTVESGESATIGPGQLHLYRNDTAEPVEFILAVTPPLP